MNVASRPLPVVAIVGRPNVGKSSLFNRIVGERRAIVEDEPGTTRDRLEADVEWMDRRFRLIDTGGYEDQDTNVYASLIGGQVRAAIESAAIVLLCIDARDGLTATDYEIARIVRESARPVIVVANKADNERRELTALADAWELGMGEPIPVSALHGINVGVMLDEVIERIPEQTALPEHDRVRIAIIGRPNVGKSMLLNALANEERVIVSDIAGTTRDAIDLDIDTPEGAFTIVDTAGIRRPGKLGVGVERHSVTRARQAIERCDVAILVVDGTEGVTSQDTHIAGMAVDAHKGLVVAVNKVDLWDDPEAKRDWLNRQMRGRLQFLPYALITFISALNKRGLGDMLTLTVQAREARRRRVATPALNSMFRKAMTTHHAPVVHSKRLKLFYATQAGIDPPTFILFVNDPKIVHFSYRRFLERSLREAFDFEGTAVKMVFKSRSEDDPEQ